MMASSNATNLILLDTDVTSFFLKGHHLADAYFPLIQGKRAAISFMTVAELYQWAEIRNWGKGRRLQLEQRLQQHYQTIGVHNALSQEWAKVRAEGRATGQPIAVQDAWIAATARHYNIPLMTHNHRHFQNVAGLQLLHP